MRIIIVLLTLTFVLHAERAEDYFKNSKSGKLFCHVAQFAYKLVSKENATIVKIRNHNYFKLKNENLYIPTLACHDLDSHKNEIIF